MQGDHRDNTRWSPFPYPAATRNHPTRGTTTPAGGTSCPIPHRQPSRDPAQRQRPDRPQPQTHTHHHLTNMARGRIQGSELQIVADSLIKDDHRAWYPDPREGTGRMEVSSSGLGRIPIPDVARCLADCIDIRKTIRVFPTSSLATRQSWKR